MKIKDGYVIKKLGTGYVVVAVGNVAKEFHGVIRMNPAGAFLWQSIADGNDTKDKLIRTMMDYYDGLDEATAGRDLDEFLDSVGFAIEAS